MYDMSIYRSREVKNHMHEDMCYSKGGLVEGTTVGLRNIVGL